jgi:hypothetical protein
MAVRSAVDASRELARRARVAAICGRHYEAADLYRRALLVLYNPQLCQSREAESPTAAATPQPPVMEENLAVDPADAANVDSAQQRTG